MFLCVNVIALPPLAKLVRHFINQVKLNSRSGPNLYDDDDDDGDDDDGTNTPAPLNNLGAPDRKPKSAQQVYDVLSRQS